MHNKQNHNDFLKKLRFELVLLVLFIVGLGLNIFNQIPDAFKTEVLGAIIIIGIIPVARSAWVSLKEKQVNVDLLATIALFFSLYTQEWSSAIFISLMLASARILGLYTERRVRKSLDGLLSLKPMWGRVRRGEEAIDIPLSEVVLGDLVLVNLGERIPVDGQVVEGSATIDQSSLTGESMPALKEVGGQVLSATVVISGNITIRTEKVGAETTFERMLALVETSQSAKTRIKTSSERFASWYIGIVLVVAFILYFLTGGDTKLILAVILVVCADDIAIAVPLAYIAGISSAARRGIIIKSADFIDGVAKITTLLVDKTGTLTTGHLTVKNVRSFDGLSLNSALELSGIICSRSTHPVAKAIVRYALEHNINCGMPEHFEEIEGRGIMGTHDNKEIIIGRLEFLKEQHIKINSEVYQAIEEEGVLGNNTTLVACDGRVVGLFVLADEVRSGVAETISALKASGIKETVMITGDNEYTAQAIAHETGIDKYHASLLPENKVSILEKYLADGHTVAMIGDGVNDAAVLARSDIGIAMCGIGSDAAIDSANIVLMKDDFSKLLELRIISKRVLTVVRQNFIIFGIVNALGLYLVFTGVFDPPKAAAYNFLTDFITIANSMRLFRYKNK